MSDDERLVDTARRLSSALTPGDLDHTLSQITAAAVEVLPGVTHASITISHADGTLDTAAPTDKLIEILDAAQYRLHQGPCYEAATETLHIASPNLAADERFPDYAAIAVAAGIRAQAAVRLFDTGKSKGALNLYSPNVGSFEDLAILSRLFAHQAAAVIGYANEIQTLREAVNTRSSIGQAVGILMERYKLNDHRAFAFLTRLSQQRNVKLRLIADQINDTVELQDGG
ncbi:GAF and ANTAR domain-containing protein [Kribbella sp. NBC_00382]|uniref:GAF and ANTAR domain-containing protein n=1 Tax=Kribbella sp. NBC_00382 TaxID=2975967 RepID=UPI002E1F722D